MVSFCAWKFVNGKVVCIYWFLGGSEGFIKYFRFVLAFCHTVIHEIRFQKTDRQLKVRILYFKSFSRTVSTDCVDT